MKVLVTGAAGVLGTAVVASLDARETSVVGAGRSEAPAGFPGTWARADVLLPGALEPWLDGVSTIVHAATNAMKPAEDLRAIDNVVASAIAANCHLVFVGIAGIEDAAAGYAYYGAKLTAEERIAASGVAHTIVRITQFHDLIDFIFGSLAIGPVFLRPAWTLQPVDPAFAGACVARIAIERPPGRAADVLGPERLDAPNFVRPWFAARNRRLWTLPAPGIGPIGALARIRRVEGESGGRTWQEWLTAHPAPGTAYRR